jgi:hypothetical protein
VQHGRRSKRSGRRRSPARLRDGQVVHGANPRRTLQPDRVAEHRLRRLPWPGLDYGLNPSVSEALTVRADRATRFREHLASVATTDFKRPIDVLENGTNRLKSASTPSLRKSSGTTARRSATLRNWRRRDETRFRGSPRAFAAWPPARPGPGCANLWIGWATAVCAPH